MNFWVSSKCQIKFQQKVKRIEFKYQSKKNELDIMPTQPDADCIKFIGKEVFPSQI